MGAKPGRAAQDGTAGAEALSGLHRDRGAASAAGCGDGRWRAARRGAAGPVLTRAPAGGVAMALRVSYGTPR